MSGSVIDVFAGAALRRCCRSGRPSNANNAGPRPGKTSMVFIAFKVQVVRWRDTAHPPAVRFIQVNQWWPRLRQPTDRTGAVRVSRENDPEGNLWWMWVPDANWLDQAGYFRVLCFFRSYERRNPPRLVCEEFRTVQAMSPAEVDQSDRSG